MSAKHLLIFAVTIAISSAQTHGTFSNITLPPELQGKVNSKDIEAMQNKTLQELKSRCDKNGGLEAFPKVQNATLEIQEYVSRNVNVTSLLQEIEEAKPNGSVDEVFKKYCAMRPQFVGRAKNFLEIMATCFSEKEQYSLKIANNITQELVEFICDKEGERIALFISEDGMECVKDQQEELKKCANTTGMSQEGLDPNSISDFVLMFDEKHCKQISELKKCMVAALETCPKPTTANIAASLFKLIRKSTPCKDFDENQKDGAATFYVTAATLVTALFATMLV